MLRRVNTQRQEVPLVSILRQVVIVSFPHWLWADLLFNWLVWKRISVQEMKGEEERGHCSKGKRATSPGHHIPETHRALSKVLLGGELKLLHKSLTK